MCYRQVCPALFIKEYLWEYFERGQRFIAYNISRYFVHHQSVLSDANKLFKQNKTPKSDFLLAYCFRGGHLRIEFSSGQPRKGTFNSGYISKTVS